MFSCGVAVQAPHAAARRCGAEPGACEAFTARVAVRTDPILRVHGYSEPAQVRADIRGAAERAAALARELCRPVAWHREIGILRIDWDGLILDGGVNLACRDVVGLPECASIVAFILTVGEALDDVVRELNAAGDVLQALFLETAAWLAIEGATKDLNTCLRGSAAQRGLGLTRRASPGYAGWPLADHAAFFSLFQGEPIAVRLLDSCAMVPKISRSGMYGLRPLSDVRHVSRETCAC